MPALRDATLMFHTITCFPQSHVSQKSSRAKNLPNKMFVLIIQFAGAPGTFETVWGVFKAAQMPSDKHNALHALATARTHHDRIRALSIATEARPTLLIVMSGGWCAGGRRICVMWLVHVTCVRVCVCVCVCVCVSDGSTVGARVTAGV